MGNRSWGAGNHAGLAQGRAEGIVIGQRQNTRQTWAAQLIGAAIVVAGSWALEKHKERRAAQRTNGAPAEASQQ